jgi:hypothetical protein
VAQEECAILRESVLYVKVYRYNPKHLYPKLNSYGDNGQRKVWSSSSSMYCTCSADGLSHPAHVVGLDQNAQSAKLNQYFNTTGFHMPCTVLGTLRTTTSLVRVFMYFNLMALCHSYVNYMLSTDINITQTTYSCQF